MSLDVTLARFDIVVKMSAYIYIYGRKSVDRIATHIVPFGKFHRIRGAPTRTFPNVKYDVPEEVGGDTKCLDSPIRK